MIDLRKRGSIMNAKEILVICITTYTLLWMFLIVEVFHNSTSDL